MSKTEFAKALEKFVKEHEGLIIQLANEFEVAQSTVRRWANGVARPHPRLQVMILKEITRLTQEKTNEI